MILFHLLMSMHRIMDKIERISFSKCKLSLIIHLILKMFYFVVILIVLQVKQVTKVLLS